MEDERKAGEALTPQELRRLGQEKAMAKAEQAMAAMRKDEEQRRELEKLFMSRKVQPEGMARLMAAVSKAAEAGKNEIMVFKFPSTYLPDGGRAINNLEKNWPDSLVGYSKEAYLFYDEHLRKLGYRLRAQIINFPDGVPGDVGFFLVW